MDKSKFLNVGDKITTKKYGRWTIVGFENGYIIMVKIRLGKVTETYKILATKLFE